MNRIALLAFTGLVFFTNLKAQTSEESHYTDHFYFREANVETSKWVAILPGSSGLTIFNDDHHYFDIADELATHFNVLIIDYKPAYKTSGRKVKESTGEKILWVLGEALDWATANHHITEGAPGSIVGWSLAGEGAIQLVNNPTLCSQLNVRSVLLYYPANHLNITSRSEIPVLILTGASDTITPMVDIISCHGDNSNTEIITYKNAHHGFDIQSLANEKSMRFPPLFGKKHVFKYDPTAAKDSRTKMMHFLNESSKVEPGMSDKL
jgi:dienelactone hydrolase